MSCETRSIEQWLKKIHMIFFIKRIFYYLTFISVMMIWFYPIFALFSTMGCFILCIRCGDIGDKFIEQYSEEYGINIIDDVLNLK